MWTERDNRLIREFRFKDFQEAFTFMTRVAFLSESHAHHPTMVNTFSYVRVELHTHDAGGVVTRKDHELARDIDALLQYGEDPHGEAPPFDSRLRDGTAPRKQTLTPQKRHPTGCLFSC